MKSEIIRKLKENNGYVSGQQLSESLGVSRTAVWKAIRRLREEGYQIEAVRNRGYRLLGSADVLTETECRERLAGCRLGSPVYCFGEIDSTNVRAKLLAEKGAPEGTLVIAESQTDGKGRRGRSWVSPPGEGLWFSLVLRPQIRPSITPTLTLVSAIAAAAGIEDVTGLPTRIKWPNDIVISGKKAVGILTELSAEAQETHYVVVGIGINVNMREFPEEIRKTATSLYLESGTFFRRSDIVAAVIKRMESYYTTYMETVSLEALRDEYTKRLVNRGREVVILEPQRERRGVCEGIDQNGCLLVRGEDGKVERVISGEVSVRGIYGYV